MLPPVRRTHYRFKGKVRMFWFKRKYFSDKKRYPTQPEFLFNLHYRYNY